MKVEIKKAEHTSSTLNLSKNLEKNGIHLENVYVDGKLIMQVGVASDQDRQNAINTINAALEESNGDIYTAMRMLQNLANWSEKEIKPDEEIDINGRRYLISYKDYKLYDLGGNEVANCNDLDESVRKKMDNEVVKALLMSRVGVRALPKEEKPEVKKETKVTILTTPAASCSCSTTTTVTTTKTTTRRKRK